MNDVRGHVGRGKTPKTSVGDTLLTGYQSSLDATEGTGLAHGILSQVKWGKAKGDYRRQHHDRTVPRGVRGSIFLLEMCSAPSAVESLFFLFLFFFFKFCDAMMEPQLVTYCTRNDMMKQKKPQARVRDSDCPHLPNANWGSIHQSTHARQNPPTEQN